MNKARSLGPWFLRSGWWLWGALLLTLLLPTVTFVFFVLRQFQTSLYNETLSQNAVVARLTAQTAQEHFSGIIKYVENFSRRQRLMSSVEKRDKEGVVDQLGELVIRNPEIDKVFITDLKGVEQFDFPHDPKVIGRDFSFRDWHQGVSKIGQT